MNRFSYLFLLLLSVTLTLTACGADSNTFAVSAADEQATHNSAALEQESVETSVQANGQGLDISTAPESEQGAGTATQPESEQGAGTAPESEQGSDTATVTEPGLEQDNPSDESMTAKTIARPEPVKVKGIYVSGPVAGTQELFGNLLELVNTTELNSMVIDVKNDDGYVTFVNEIAVADDIEASRNYIRDVHGLIETLNSNEIYSIARIVAFRDPLLPTVRPELAIKNKDGSVFRDKNGMPWVDPYNEEVWKYIVDIAEGAAKLGFKEIQFDYIRFSTDSGMKNALLGENSDKSKVEVITEFTKYAMERLKPLGVYVAADVFGTVIDSKVDADIIGQDYAVMGAILDYVCPMVYPSHYGSGSMGIKDPDLAPYDVINKSMNLSKEQLAAIPEGENRALVRPWLQDFTATWVKPHQKYGVQQVRDQIKGAADAGVDEWILWNAANRYTVGALELQQ